MSLPPPAPVVFSDDQRKHLEMIQAVVTRLAGNSFAIRGWSVGLVTALLAFTAKDPQRFYILIAYFPCVVFWCLDIWYLRIERRFRSLFVAAAAGPGQTAVPLYGMDPEQTAGLRDTWLSVFFSVTTLGFHLPLFAVISIVMWLVPKVSTCP